MSLHRSFGIRLLRTIPEHPPHLRLEHFSSWWKRNVLSLFFDKRQSLTSNYEGYAFSLAFFFHRRSNAKATANDIIPKIMKYAGIFNLNETRKKPPRNDQHQSPLVRQYGLCPSPPVVLSLAP